ncbi:DNA-directed DNA polymerase [Giardia muris]|uniref:DNA polymerase kappa n=1 Tax=Giardia muris TaxID=5742 RepID=A0A4Z1T770_GIAMU|nr:DNA-directed DNA polymerase [Giardia muris]|eukprot:TNJ28341.1 DNA-directed DNA polymerase [Giardia muris]
MNRRGELDDLKAGLQGVDRNTVNRVIQEATKGSARSVRQASQTQLSCARSHQLEAKAYQLTKQEKLQGLEKADGLINEGLKRIALRQIIVFLDFDCFFAAVECRDNPDLVGKPLAVAGGGIVSASSYEARAFGIRSAMPLRVAMTLCPTLIVKKVNMSRYAEVSQEAASIFEEYDPAYSMLGLDECSLNLTTCVQNLAFQRYQVADIWDEEVNRIFLEQYASNSRRKGRMTSTATPARVLRLGELPEGNLPLVEALAVEVCTEIREKVHSKLKVTCSLGISTTRQHAKMCVDCNKPNGVTLMRLSGLTPRNYISIRLSEVGHFPIRKIWGIGDATAQLLARAPFNVDSINQLYDKRGLVAALLSDHQLRFLALASSGLADLVYCERYNRNLKSVSQDKTFPETSDMVIIRRVIKDLCKVVCLRLADLNLVPTKMNLKVRFADWEERTHIVTLVRPSISLDILFNGALEALAFLLQQKHNAIALGACQKFVIVGIGERRHAAHAADLRLCSVVAHSFQQDEEGKGTVLQQLAHARARVPKIPPVLPEEREEDSPISISDSGEENEKEKREKEKSVMQKEPARKNKGYGPIDILFARSVGNVQKEAR